MRLQVETGYKRVLIITDITEAGGVDTYIIALARFAKHEGWDISILMDDMKGSDILYKYLFMENIPILRKGLYRRTNTNEEIGINTQEALLNFNPSLVHVVCGSPRSAIIPRNVALDMNYPLFFTEQYLEPNFEFTSWQHTQLKMIYRKADGIIAVCEENKKLLEEHYNLISKKTVVIPNSIDLNNFAIQKHLQRKDTYKVLCIGRLVQQKGFDILIKAISLLDENTKARIRISIYGDGPEGPILKVMVKKLGLQKEIEFLGWVPNVSKQIINYDLFILPSRHEGQPFVLIEAIASGLPCIASKVSGISELFCNGRGGSFIEPENPTSIARLITEFINDPQPFFEKSKFAFSFIKNSHNLPTNMIKLLNWWNSVIISRND